MIIPPIRIFERPVPFTVPFALTAEQYLLVKPLGDIHHGNPGCVPDRLKYDVEWGLERGAYFLGMGDYFDLSSESQARIMAQLRLEEQEHYEELQQVEVDALAAILGESRGRWLGMLAGNHNTHSPSGFSMARKLCKALGADWLADMGCVRLKVGPPPRPAQASTGADIVLRDERADVMIICHHGLGGGRRAGSSLPRLEDMVVDFPQGDIYLMAHVHRKANEPLDSIHIAPNGVQYHRTKLLARTGSWLRGYRGLLPPHPSEPDRLFRGSYIERGAMRSVALGGLCIGIGRKYVEDADVWVPDIHMSV